MVSMQVRQSEGSGFKSWSGQIVYFHGVKTRLSTLVTGDVPRGSDSTSNSRACLTKFGGHKRMTGDARLATTGVFRELDWDYSGN